MSVPEQRDTSPRMYPHCVPALPDLRAHVALWGQDKLRYKGPHDRGSSTGESCWSPHLQLLSSHL